ncbi:MAG TPA: hypothetical protein VF414_09770 [Thermoanaerobaculia bacterium]
MRAWAKVCALLVLVLAMAVAAEGADKKGRGICPDDKKACQVGEDEYVCVDPDDKCPEPNDLPRSLCPDGKKACQVDDDKYVCIDPDDNCP